MVNQSTVQYVPVDLELYAFSQMFESDKLYSPKEVAETMGVNIQTIYAWTKGANPKLKCIKINTLTKIQGEVLNNFILTSNLKKD